jgi:hypothetical protein
MTWLSFDQDSSRGYNLLKSRESVQMAENGRTTQ